ncbi:hypothetical protein QUA54_28970 [Microcoleus sp. MOSTC5]|uniref:hypothetical protein n=1 Tax=Microcoleus sp. MOSTC5 TaxID=3055378 RepID=UPI002FD6A80A
MDGANLLPSTSGSRAIHPLAVSSLAVSSFDRRSFDRVLLGGKRQQFARKQVSE